ncbi:acetate--CoA ligase family protein [Chelativorans sp. YIM 93263]|uniref:acetate--CoA ligase family protein n=1 Tax=Chelativorans sp. YIM 93263 TaxID=2906648 RepID=UPI002378D858|nr:acetate--CoA ligase family protein [Chelativorans sp. YIM 93263]
MNHDPVQSAERLARLFSPRSIAIVGASANKSSFGARFMANLAGFEGRLHLVNPRYDDIDGMPCSRSLRDLPEAPDCVIVATGLATVEAIFEDCIAVGAGGVVMIASGFAETGEADTAAIQDRLATRAAESGVPLLGPNAIGFVNFSSRAGATFLTGLDFERGFDRAPEDRRIGLVSQSGALGLSLAQAMNRGVFFSHVLSCGNSADVDLADCANFLVDDPACKVIVCLLEGLTAPRRLEEVTRRATAAGKPIILCKMAHGDTGAQAAASHTGSLAGSHAAYRSMIERAGGIVIDAFEDLLETACFLSKVDAPTGDGAMVIATSGGAAILSADAAEAAGVPLPQPDSAVRDTLRAHIPSFGSARNPADVTAEVVNNVESLTACVRTVLDEDGYAALVVPHPLAYETAYPRIELLDRLGREAGKVISLVWLSGWLEGPGAREIEIARNLALFRSMDRCFETIRIWTDWHRRRAQLQTTASVRVSVDEAGREVATALAASPHRTIAEREAKALLAAYGVPVTTDWRATSAEAARQAVVEMGGRLVMKIDSPDIAHKTEVGGIALNLDTPEAVAAAYEQMMDDVSRNAPDAAIDGVILQRMIPEGIEIVVGARIDPAFGPLVLVGLGGVMVELLADSVTAPAPVTPDQALRMLENLRGAKLLDGFRGLPAVDRQALADIIARVSEFAADHANQLAELDLNPLICRGSDIIAADALIVLADRTGSRQHHAAAE